MWLSSIISNSGLWAYTVAAQWQVTSLSASPSVVSMVQVASSLPQFLFLFPAGALVDLVDRRRTLIAAQGTIVLFPLLLAMAAWAGYTQIWLLLLVTFVIGTATAFSAPVWQIMVSEVVPPEQLNSAVALNSVSINVARSVGPAIGGAVVTAFGAASGWFLSSLGGLGVLFVACRQPIGVSRGFATVQTVIDAVMEGLQFIRNSPRVRAILIREATFVFFASALWALLPVIAMLELGMRAKGYGMLMGCLGMGALSSALVTPWLQRFFTGNQLAIPSTILYSVACVVPALADQAINWFVALFVGGAGWTSMLILFNTGLQTQAPAWVRGRAVSAQGLVLFGLMALGSVFWGHLAEYVGLKATFLAAGLGMLITLVLHCRYALTTGGKGEFDEV